MKFPKRKYFGVFIRRDSRFSATVKIGHRLEYVFVPNSGRMKELLKLGNEVLLSQSRKGDRKTRLNLILVQLPDQLISIDSRVPNKLFKELFHKKLLKSFRKFKNIKAEPKFGKSRFDFLLTGNKESPENDNSQKCYLEIKSVTLVREKVAYFPDAPTERGTRHLKELIKAREEGFGTGIIFFIQRKDVREFRPNDSNDPAFGKALRLAVKKGVGVYAYSCSVSEKEIKLARKIPVRLD